VADLEALAPHMGSECTLKLHEAGGVLTASTPPTLNLLLLLLSSSFSCFSSSSSSSSFCFSSSSSSSSSFSSSSSSSYSSSSTFWYEHSPYRYVMLRSRLECLFSMTLVLGAAQGEEGQQR
jgi:hypothetical protein